MSLEGAGWLPIGAMRLAILVRPSALWLAGARFVGDRRASISILSASVLALIVGFAAISMDGGNYYYQRRRQQTATDFAAVAAATDLSRASTLASLSASANGFDPSALVSVEQGIYATGSALPPGQRFAPASQKASAVQVTMLTQPPFILGRALRILTQTLGGGPGTGGSSADVDTSTGFAVRTRAVATVQNVASFSLGTGLAQLNGGIENAILGAMLGSQIGLSAMDWQALASAQVDLFSFAPALAARGRLSATTFNTVASSSVSSGQALAALLDVLATANASTQARSAMTAIIAAGGPLGATIQVDQLVSFGPFGNVALTAVRPTIAMVSAFDLLSAILQLMNAQHTVQGSIVAAVPGIGAVTFKITIGEPLQWSSLLAVGTQGTTLHSAQTRVLFTIQLNGLILGSVVSLPLYVEVASGTARLATIACTSGIGEATLSVTPGVIDAFIGAVSDSDMTNMGAAPSPPAGILLNVLGLAQVAGRAHASIGNLSESQVSFTASEISTTTRKTTSTTDIATSLFGSLLGDLRLTVTVLGGSAPIGLDGSVKQALTNAAVPVNQVIAGTFSALGLGVGTATTSISAVRCGRSILAN